MILILLLILAATLLYWKLSNHYNYFANNGIKQNRTILYGDKNILDRINDMYNACPEDRYFGLYQLTLPTLLIRDPELVKQITVKDFDHFLNHRALVPEGVEPLWNKNLFALKDANWRDMRSKLSPNFTSSKMKIIFSLISECADEFMDHFLKKGEGQILEMKDTFARYTNDVIASVAFGIKCNSINERDNQFYNMGGRATKLGSSAGKKIVLYLLAPNLSKKLGIKFFPKEVSDFFVNVVKDTIRARESQGIVRPDMLNLLLEARKGKKLDDTETNDTIDAGFATVEEMNLSKDSKNIKENLTDIDIAAQGLVFFFGGFESTATLMTFTAYELALCPEIQKKLQNEIDETLADCNGKLTYEALMKMKYMDMVISEALRKWPAAVVTDRICSKNYTIQPVHKHEKPVHLKPGELLWIPISGFHYDPNYFPNPHEFDPERFNDENKINIKPYTYFPFGTGPRNCIGSRFALMETKTILFYILSKFDLLTCSKTDIPVKLDKKAMQLATENGMWLEMKPRIK